MTTIIINIIITRWRFLWMLSIMIPFRYPSIMIPLRYPSIMIPLRYPSIMIPLRYPQEVSVDVKQHGSFEVPEHHDSFEVPVGFCGP